MIKRKSTFKPDVPKLSSSEIREQIKQRPINKNEILDYMIRLQKQGRKIDEKTYHSLTETAGFKEIQQEIKTHRQKQKDCKKIMYQCAIEEQDTENAVQKLDKQVLSQKLRCNEFNGVLNMIRDLDSCKPEAFPLLYAFKGDDIDAQILMSQDQTNEYKSGKNDPSKTARAEKFGKQMKARQRNKKLNRI